MRATALQADGLHVLQRDEAQPPAIPAEGDRRLDDLPGLTGELEFPVGRVHDPDLAPGQRHGTGQPTAVIAEEEDGVGLVDDAELGGQVLAAGERDEDGAHRPVERVGGLRRCLGRADPHGAALHGMRVAVRGDPPAGDAVGRVADGGQQHVDALAVRVERDPRLRLPPGRRRRSGQPVRRVPVLERSRCPAASSSLAASIM